MGALGYVLKAGARGLAKQKGDNPYWDPAHIIKHSPKLVVKAAHGVHKAYVAVRDHPKPFTTESAQYRFAKMAADDRIPKLDPVVDAKVGAAELAKDHGVANSYLEYLMQRVSDKDSIKLIRSYVQSNAADNLTPHERTELMIKCCEKLRYLDMIHQFFT